MFFLFLDRIGKHLRGEDTGIAGSKFNKIFIDVFIKALLKGIFWLINRPLDVKINNYQWRRRGLNEERKKIIDRIRDSHYLYDDVLETVINASFLLADNDRPYYGIYENIKYEIQRMDNLKELDMVFPDLREDINPANEIEKSQQVVKYLKDEYNVSNRDILERMNE